VNNLCGLVGYYCAAKVIDMPSVGRKKLQCFSFMLCGIIFLTAGAIFNKTSPQVLMFLYFFSSFVVNFGPNVTTYVMAAETYPTELRGTCHGSKYTCLSSFFFKLVLFSLRMTCSIGVLGKGRSFDCYNRFSFSYPSPNLLRLWRNLCRRNYLLPDLLS
jgi:hypothetical protein